MYAMLGMTYCKVDDYERASGALNKAIRLNPSDGFTQFALGSAIPDVVSRIREQK